MSILPKILKLFKSRKLLLSIVLVGVFVMASFAVVGVVDAQEEADNINILEVLGAVINPSGTLAQLIVEEGPKKAANITLDIFIAGVIWLLNLLFGIIILIEGVIIAIFTALLKVVVGYNGFVESTAVQVGWTLVRDLTNLFFVVVLLIIAFGTILRLGESYSIKKLLPKVLIMAVLVNFSLVIAGLLIDASQVVMLTFVAAFDESVGFNLFNTLSIPEATSAQDFVDTGDPKELISTLVSVFANNFLAILFLFISMFTIVVMTLIFIARIVALWILLVLAPLPYVLFAFPKLKQYATMWWTEFTKYLIIGPVMAFFLWLAFAVVNQGGFSLFEDAGSGGTGSNVAVNEFLKDSGIFTKILEKSEFTKYVISIAMLFAGMIAAQKAGVVGASMAGSVVNRARAIGTGVLKGAGRWSLRTADETQAKFFKNVLLKPLGNTGIGRKLGIDIAGKEGIKVRDLPHAWRFRRERIERQRDARSKEATTDLLNRIVPSFSREETQERRKKYSEDIATAKKRQRDSSDDVGEVMAELPSLLTSQQSSKPGRIKPGKQILVEAIFHLLGEEHNSNEGVFDVGAIIPAFKDTLKEYTSKNPLVEVDKEETSDVQAEQQERRDSQLEKISEIRSEQKDRIKKYNDSLPEINRFDIDSASTGATYTPQSLTALMAHVFGGLEEDERNRAMFDIQETNWKGSDPQMKYGVVKDVKTGKYIRQTPEQRLEYSKSYAEKEKGRNWVQNYKWQHMLDEERIIGNDGEEHTTAFNLSDFGLQLHLKNPGALTAEWHLASSELKTKFTDNSDVIYSQMQEYDRLGGKENHEKRDELGGLLRNVIGFKLHLRDGRANTEEVFEAAQKARSTKKEYFEGLVDDKYTKAFDENDIIEIKKDKKEEEKDKKKEKGDDSGSDDSDYDGSAEFNYIGDDPEPKESPGRDDSMVEPDRDAYKTVPRVSSRLVSPENDTQKATQYRRDIENANQNLSAEVDAMSEASTLNKESINKMTSALDGLRGELSKIENVSGGNVDLSNSYQETISQLRSALTENTPTSGNDIKSLANEIRSLMDHVDRDIPAKKISKGTGSAAQRRGEAGPKRSGNNQGRNLGSGRIPGFDDRRGPDNKGKGNR